MVTASDAADRFEFRMWFAPRDAPRTVFDAFAEETPEGPEERTDVYLLPRGRPWFLPKIREGRFEVKRLVELAADGLERWEVVASARFPLDTDALALATEVFGAARWSEGVDGRSAERLLEWARSASGSIAVLAARKRRHRFACGRLMAERTLVELPEIGRTAGVTIGLECDRAEPVRAFLAETGLAALPNLGYGAFLGYYAETGILPVSRAPAHLQPACP